MKRRKTIPQAALAGPSGVPAHLLKTPYEQQERASMATQRTPPVEEYEVCEELYKHLSEKLNQIPENAQPIERIMTMCGALCQAEMEKCVNHGDRETADILDEVCGQYLGLVKHGVLQGTIRVAPDMYNSGSIQLGDADLKVYLEARKAGLRNRLQLLKDVSWYFSCFGDGNLVISVSFVCVFISC